MTNAQQLALIPSIKDRFGDAWDLYLWVVRREEFESGRYRHAIEWWALPPGTKPTAAAMEGVGDRRILLHFGKGCSNDHDIGHGFWRPRSVVGPHGARPFLKGSPEHAQIVEQSMVALDAMIELGATES